MTGCVGKANSGVMLFIAADSNGEVLAFLKPKPWLKKALMMSITGRERAM